MLLSLQSSVFLRALSLAVMLTALGAGLWGASFAHADTDPVIRYHTQEWKNLTNNDGSGLYHELVQSIFGTLGYRVEVGYFPFRRALHNVVTGSADISGGTVDSEPDVLPSGFPIWHARLGALMHKDKLKKWHGMSTLKANKAKTVGAPGFKRIFDVDIHEVAHRRLALKMLLDDRMDFYIDEMATLIPLNAGHAEVLGFENTPEELVGLKNKLSDYTVREARTVPLYMVFQKTERGKRLRDLFDAGMRRMQQTGELARLYSKWGLLDRMHQDGMEKE